MEKGIEVVFMQRPFKVVAEQFGERGPLLYAVQQLEGRARPRCIQGDGQRIGLHIGFVVDVAGTEEGSRDGMSRRRGMQKPVAFRIVDEILWFDLAGVDD